MDKRYARTLGDALESVAAYFRSGFKKNGDVLVAAVNLFKVVYPEYPEVINVAVRFFQTLEKMGIEMRHLQNVITDKKMRDNLVRYVKIGCPEINHNNLLATTATYQIAQAMLEDWQLIFPKDISNEGNLIYTKEQLLCFQKSFPTMDILQWCVDNKYMLIAGPPKPMSLFEIYQLNPGFFCDEYIEESIPRSFKEDKVELEWLMIRSEVIEVCGYWWDSNGNFSDADKLPETDRIPNVAEIAWAQYVCKTKRKGSIMRWKWGQNALTSTVTDKGNHIIIGWPKWDKEKHKDIVSEDMPIFIQSDVNRNWETGLITVRNLPKP